MESQSSHTESRRKFLKTAGKFAVYTPPALMLMTKANAHKMARSNGVKRNYDERKKGYKKGHYRKRRSLIISILRWFRRWYG